jgi:hypothetical protein
MLQRGYIGKAFLYDINSAYPDALANMPNITKGTFDNIGKFSKVTRDLDINADRGRWWIGELTDVRKKETNSVSTPFSFPEFDPDKI